MTAEILPFSSGERTDEALAREVKPAVGVAKFLLGGDRTTAGDHQAGVGSERSSLTRNLPWFELCKRAHRIGLTARELRARARNSGLTVLEELHRAEDFVFIHLFKLYAPEKQFAGTVTLLIERRAKGRVG